jgi:RNA-binding protein YhbY
MSYRDLVNADRRLIILKLLLEDGGHGNEAVLEKGLEMLGHRAGLERAVVREYLRFLETAGLVKIEFFRDTIMVAEITERGVKAAKGQITVDGVAQPTPGG